MGAVLLLATAIGLAVYGGLVSLKSYSPRNQMIKQLGLLPATRRSTQPESRLARWLRQVPVTRRISVREFRALQASCAGAAILILSLPWLVLGSTPDLLRFGLYPALAWLLPECWLGLQARRRTALLDKAYPDLLAHLVTQTRAGTGTLQAFASSPPVLREPLQSEVAELVADMGLAPFPAALERFAARCGTADIRAFAQNVIYQQSLGIALPEVLAAEETHSLAMAKQVLRRRIQGTAVTMAAVTVILLLNGLLVYFAPVLYDLARWIANP
ncbi:MAG: type II secretion system F family protein [Mycobacterium leprae]